MLIPPGIYTVVLHFTCSDSTYEAKIVKGPLKGEIIRGRYNNHVPVWDGKAQIHIGVGTYSGDTPNEKRSLNERF